MNNQREICVEKRVELHFESSHATRVVKYGGLLICKLAVYRVKSLHREDYNLSQSHRYRDILQPSWQAGGGGGDVQKKTIHFVSGIPNAIYAVDRTGFVGICCRELRFRVTFRYRVYTSKST